MRKPEKNDRHGRLTRFIENYRNKLRLANHTKAENLNIQNCDNNDESIDETLPEKSEEIYKSEKIEVPEIQSESFVEHEKNEEKKTETAIELEKKELNNSKEKKTRK